MKDTIQEYCEKNRVLNEKVNELEKGKAFTESASKLSGHKIEELIRLKDELSITVSNQKVFLL